RRHQRRVRADERAVLDPGLVLEEAVVVAGDGAGADVDLAPDHGIADIGQMIGLAALAEPRRLELDEIADVDIGAELRARAEACEGTHNRAVTDDRTHDVAHGADPHALAHPHARAEYHGGLDHGVAPDRG